MKKRLCLCFLALALLLPMVAVSGQAQQIPVAEFSQTMTAAPDPGLPENEELFDAYAGQILYGNEFAFLGTAAGDRLTGDAKVLYDALVPVLKQIANGERTNTTISVGQTVIGSDGITYVPDVEATFTSATFTNALYNDLIMALLSDYPYEMYWYDKTKGCSLQLWSSDTVLYASLSFTVCANYSAGEYITDPARVTAANTAAANAKDIVKTYVSGSDYDKLLGYSNSICELVDYDYAAASSGNFSTDDDPWQLIQVFDGDETTKVVCEGYSKAYMYLCDLSDFSGDTACYTVTGTMGGGGHMWNVVTLEGKNYLVDVTNSETDAVGNDGSLFLAGGTGSAAAGYTFAGYQYLYDDRTQAQWGTGADSILTLADASYTPVVEEPTATGTCGTNVTWAFYEGSGKLVISGTGDMKDYTNSNGMPWYSYKDSIRTVVIESGVTSVGDMAFYGFSNLTTVSLPEGITDIGECAFHTCGALTGISIPAGVKSIGEYAFYTCSSMTSANIPEGVTTIGPGAFANCSALTGITVPGSVSCFGQEAFASSGLTSITIEEGVTEIPVRAFLRCGSLESVTVSTGIESIGEGAFYSCSALAEITIPEGVTSIGSNAFYECESLTSITIPGSVSSFGGSAFYSCSGLTTVTIGEGVTELPGQTFRGCGNLTSITIPKSVASMGNYAFYNCYELTDIYISDMKAWLNISCSGTRSNPMSANTKSKNLYLNGELVTELVIPEGVTSIPDYAFYYCGLTGATIPEGVTSIGQYAFCGCRTLTTVTIPESVTAIGEAAFLNCDVLTDVHIGEVAAWLNISFKNEESNPLNANRENKNLYLKGELLTDLVIPEGITTVQNYAFYNCSNLTSITIPESVTSIGGSTLYGCSNLTDVCISDIAAWMNLTENSSPLCANTKNKKLYLDGKLVTNLVIPEGVTQIGKNAFYTLSYLKTVSIPESVKNIGDSAFYYCSSLTSVTIPEGVESIGGAAFYRCSSLTSVTIPDSVTSIDSSAFSSCSSLTSVSIPAGITEIPSYAFDGCGSLTSVTIPAGVTKLGYRAFAQCSSLNSITIPETVTEIADSVFNGCSGLESVSIPGSVKTIGGYAFSSCSGLTSVTLGEGITSIGGSAFSGCTRLTSLTVPGSVTDMGNYAFAFCSKLTDLTIGEGIEEIPQYAFQSCSGMTTVNLPASVLLIDYAAFDGCRSLTTVNYSGTDAQKEEIVIAAKNDYLTNAAWNTGVCSHSFDQWQRITEPTCTEPGEETRACALCGETESRGIPATGHSYGSWTTLREPTCTVAGEEEQTCFGCGDVLSREIPATGHSYDETVTAPTCTENGYTNYVCSACGDSYAGDEVAALGHSYGEWVTMMSPTCEEAGEEQRTCNVCGDEQIREIPTLDHSYGSWKQTEAPSCTVSGAERRDCANCYAFETRAIPATGHSYEEVVTLPTCTEGGYTTYTCGTCGDNYIGNETETVDHSFGDWVVVKEATVTEEGEEARECSVCGELETRVLSKLKLEAPTVKASANTSTGKNKLSWNKVEGASYYRVYRATSKTGTYKLVKSTSSVSYTDTSAKAGTNYYYKVLAVNSETGKTSAYSSVVNRMCDLPKPVVKMSVNTSTGKPKLSWGKISGAAKYRVYRATSEGGTYKLVKTTTSTSYTDTDAKAGKEYFYKVKAVHSKSSADSAYSDIVSRVCDLKKPTVSIKLSKGDPKVTWSKVSGASKYRIYRATSKSGTYTLIKTTTKTGYTDTTAKAGKTYYYKVKAVHSNAEANSAYSSVKSIKAK